MKLYFFLFVLLVGLVHVYSSYAELTESSSDNDNLKQFSKRKLNALWGKRSMNNWEKRLTKTWGKRSESDSDELYQHILRDIYHAIRLHQSAHPQYSVDTDSNPLTLEQLLAQRTTWNDENENTAENIS